MNGIMSNDTTAFNANTAVIPWAAMMAPARPGPSIREALKAMLLSANAPGSCVRGTSCGTMDA
ncbi:hypothetical protein D9M68_850080 [compost metagenome]